MGISETTTGLDNLRFDARSIMDKVEDALKESLDEGANDMREIIETSGTGNTWKRASSSGRQASAPGRVDTGAMLGDVDSQISDRGDNYVEGWMGWKENSPLYYRLQDNGFRHVLSGRDISGMMALRDAGEEAESILEEKLRRIV